MAYSVYLHTFPNGKKYIGVTRQNPLDRWNNGYGYRNQKLVFRAILKHGWDNIKHEVLFSDLSKKEAEEKEIELIAFYKSDNPQYGYNILRGGDVSRGEYHPTEDDIKKQSKAMKERFKHIPHWMNSKKLTDEWKQHIREGNTGKHAKEKHHFYGKHLSETHRKNLSKSLSKKVYQYSLDGRLINEYASTKEAKAMTGVDCGHISACCNGKRKTAGAFIWRYDE